MNAPVNPWAWYKAALKDPKLIGTPDLPVHENEIHCGYFRMKKGRGKRGWNPVVIGVPPMGAREAHVGLWEGGMKCDAGSVWTYCCRYPISYEIWTAVAVRGEPFPDSIEHLIVKKPDIVSEGIRIAHDMLSAEASGDATKFEELRVEAAALRSIGDNSGDVPADPITSLYDRLQEAVGKARAEIQDAAKKKPEPGKWTEEARLAADRLANFATAIASIDKEIAAAGEAEKAPLFAKHKAAVAKWKPLEDTAKAIIRDLKDAVGFFLKAQREFERAEAERKAEEERRRAEAADPGIPDFDQAPVTVEAPKVAAGTSGRKVTLVEIVTAKIYDRKALINYILDLNNEVTEELMRLVQQMANRWAPHVNKGLMTKPPGMEVVVEEKTR